MKLRDKLPPGYTVRQSGLRYYTDWVVAGPDGVVIARHSGAHCRRAKASVAVAEALAVIEQRRALLAILGARVKAMLPPGVIVNPEWLEAGPGSEVTIHFHPGARPPIP